MAQNEYIVKDYETYDEPYDETNEEDEYFEFQLLDRVQITGGYYENLSEDFLTEVPEYAKRRIGIIIERMYWKNKKTNPVYHVVLDNIDQNQKIQNFYVPQEHVWKWLRGKNELGRVLPSRGIFN